MRKFFNVNINNQTLIISENGASIPQDEANTDYQAYLAWLEAGNTSEPWEAE